MLPGPAPKPPPGRQAERHGPNRRQAAGIGWEYPAGVLSVDLRGSSSCPAAFRGTDTALLRPFVVLLTVYCPFKISARIFAPMLVRWLYLRAFVTLIRDGRGGRAPEAGPRGRLARSGDGFQLAADAAGIEVGRPPHLDIGTGRAQPPLDPVLRRGGLARGVFQLAPENSAAADKDLVRPAGRARRGPRRPDAEVEAGDAETSAFRRDRLLKLALRHASRMGPQGGKPRGRTTVTARSRPRCSARPRCQTRDKSRQRTPGTAAGPGSHRKSPSPPPPWPVRHPPETKDPDPGARRTAPAAANRSSGRWRAQAA